MHEIVAANFWAVFVFCNKLVSTLYKWATNGEELSFVYHFDKDADQSREVQWCLLATLLFLIVNSSFLIINVALVYQNDDWFDEAQKLFVLLSSVQLHCV